VAESILAIIGLVRYFSKGADDQEDTDIDTEVEKDLDLEDEKLEAMDVDQDELEFPAVPEEGSLVPEDDRTVAGESGQVGTLPPRTTSRTGSTRRGRRRGAGCRWAGRARCRRIRRR